MCFYKRFVHYVRRKTGKWMNCIKEVNWMIKQRMSTGMVTWIYYGLHYWFMYCNVSIHYIRYISYLLNHITEINGSKTTQDINKQCNKILAVNQTYFTLHFTVKLFENIGTMKNWHCYYWYYWLWYKDHNKRKYNQLRFLLSCWFVQRSLHYFFVLCRISYFCA